MLHRNKTNGELVLTKNLEKFSRSYEVEGSKIKRATTDTFDE